MTPHSILIVDDEANQRLMLEQALRALAFGWTIATAASGQEALDSLALHQPDLIILDVQLPGIDGYAVCNELKRNPATWQIPIIMVTVEGERR